MAVSQKGQDVSQKRQDVGEKGPKDRILDLALKLMAERGARGMSMRDLASAAGVNVATIYHYFPSKRDLLTSVMQEHGYLGGLAETATVDAEGTLADRLALLLDQSWKAMLELEDYIRLLVGEALRADSAAQTVGEELLLETEASLAEWVRERAPSLVGPSAGGDPREVSAVARLLRAILIGVFFEHLTGAAADPGGALNERAKEVGRILGGTG